MKFTALVALSLVPLSVHSLSVKRDGEASDLNVDPQVDEAHEDNSVSGEVTDAATGGQESENPIDPSSNGILIDITSLGESVDEINEEYYEEVEEDFDDDFYTYLNDTSEEYVDAAAEWEEDEESESLPWSRSVYKRLVHTAPWSKISYCYNSFTDIFKQGPLADACPKLSFCRADRKKKCSEIIQTFAARKSEGQKSGTGFVGVNHCKKEVYVSFRGSITIGDWLTDVTFNYCPYVPVLNSQKIDENTFSSVTSDTRPEVIAAMMGDTSDEEACEDCKVHCGVYSAYTTLIGPMRDAAQPFVDEGYQLIVTGQSLGGGYTYLAGIDFLLAGYNPLVISYAALRIGNPAWNAFVDEQFNTVENDKIIQKGGKLPIPSFSRVYQQTDFVPRLPPGPGYTHSGLQFEITKVKIPHRKENVLYLGPSDNYENSPFEYNLRDPLSLTIAYQHIYEFVRHSDPCNDWDYPGVPKTIDGFPI